MQIGVEAMTATRRGKIGKGGLVDPAARLMRAVRKAEVSAADKVHAAIRSGRVEREKDAPPVDPGTGQTILKLSGSPIARLIDDGALGPEEIQAAVEIEKAITAIASRLMVRGMSLERVDRSMGPDASAGRQIKAVENYTRWANHWSDRAKAYADPMLEIIIAVVVDQRAIRTVASDVGRHHSKVKDAVILGLRDYAARAGMVSGTIAQRWMDAAGALFVDAHPGLLDAIRRAKVER